jgi:hypothetical protein
MQPHLIDNLEKKITEEVSKINNYTTPGSPYFKIMTPTNELKVIKANFHSRFRSCGYAPLFY